MENKMENEMETGGIEGFNELKLSYHNGYIEYIIGFPQYGNLI